MNLNVNEKNFVDLESFVNNYMQPVWDAYHQMARHTGCEYSFKELSNQIQFTDGYSGVEINIDADGNAEGDFYKGDYVSVLYDAGVGHYHAFALEIMSADDLYVAPLISYNEYVDGTNDYTEILDKATALFALYKAFYLKLKVSGITTLQSLKGINIKEFFESVTDVANMFYQWMTNEDWVRTHANYFASQKHEQEQKELIRAYKIIKQQKRELDQYKNAATPAAEAVAANE